MENRKQQSRNLEPIQDNDRQGERNPRVYLTVKVFQASKKLNHKRCHFSFPVFLKKPVSVHNLQNNNGYVANTIIFRFSKHRGTVLYRFC